MYKDDYNIMAVYELSGNKIIEFIKNEAVFCLFIFLLIIMSILYPDKIANYPSFVDWGTIISLTGLLVITTGLKESGFLELFAVKISKKLTTEREVSFFFVLFAVLLSMFLTNDVTLFIVIPLTVSLQNILKNDISKLIIFEAISVNVGSALTPVGNPQNLFLWHKWNVSFINFIANMVPLFVVMLIILLIFVWFLFPDRKIVFSDINTENKPRNKTLFFLSMTMLVLYLIALEFKQVHLALLFLLLLYVIFYRSVLLKTDWILLFLFVVIFIDFRIISTIPIISKSIHVLNMYSSANIFLFSAVTSQLVSNVPSAVFVSSFSHDWFAISYGVNVGGNGLVIGSLANIIALRMVNIKNIWLIFHKYSVPYFLISMVIVYALFIVVF